MLALGESIRALVSRLGGWGRPGVVARGEAGDIQPEGTSMNRHSRSGAVLALAAGMVAAQGTAALAAQAAQVGPASSVTVHCGEIISTSITVANNLSCPTGTALTIAADHITVNLGGHTISGGGANTGVLFTPSDTEIEITDAPLTNGTLEDFAPAVALSF